MIENKTILFYIVYLRYYIIYNISYYLRIILTVKFINLMKMSCIFKKYLFVFYFKFE